MGFDISGNTHIDKPVINMDFVSDKSIDKRFYCVRGSTATYFDGKSVKGSENLLKYSQAIAGWTSTNMGRTDNAVAAPDGTTTAMQLTESTATAAHNIYAQNYSSIGLQSVFSVFVKRNGRDVQLLVGNNDVDNINNTYANFDLANGTLGTVGSGVQDATITDYGNGWYRISIAYCSIVSDTQATVLGFITSTTAGRDEYYTGDGSSGVYAWGFQKEHSIHKKPSAYVPTTTLAKARYIAHLATAKIHTPRIEHEPDTFKPKGLLIESAATNQIVRSEDFTSTWGADNITVYSNATISPTGELNASKICKSNTTDSHQLAIGFSHSAGLISGSFFAKAGEETTLKSTMYNSTDTHIVNVTWDLSAGTYAFNNTTTGYKASMTYCGDGWYLCTCTGTATTTSSTFYFYPKDAGTHQGNAFNGIYLFGVQAEDGEWPTSYIPTSGTTVTRSSENLILDNADTIINNENYSIYLDAHVQFRYGLGYPNVFAYRASTDANTRQDLFFVGSNGSLANNFVYNSTTLTQLPHGNYTTGEFDKKHVVSYNHLGGAHKAMVTGGTYRTTGTNVFIGNQKDQIRIGNSTRMIFRFFKVYNTSFTQSQIEEMVESDG